MISNGEQANQFGSNPLRRSTFPPTLWVASGILLALLLAATRIATGPVVQADEGSYLLNAAAIAGRLTHSEILYNYYSGYSLLLTPLFLATYSFDAIYASALIVNALLVASLPFALFRVLDVTFPLTSRQTKTVAAIASACYAPLLALSQYALSDIALSWAYAWSLAAGGMALARRSLIAAIACGFLLGFMFLVHARGAPLALPVLVSFALLAFVKRETRPVVVTITLSAVAISALHWPLEILAGKSAVSHIHSESAVAMISRINSWHAAATILLNAGGALTVVIVGSSGLIIVLAMFALREFCRGADGWSRPNIDLPLAILLGCFGALAACIVTTALFFNPPQRVDHVAYGRYVLAALIPLLSLAIAYAGSSKSRALREMRLAWLAGIAAIFLMLVGFLRIPHPANNFNTVNTVEFFLAYKIAGSHIDWLVIGAWFTLSCGLIQISARRFHYGLPSAFVAMNVGLAICMFAADTVHSRKFYARDRYIIEAAQAFHKETGVPLCITIDARLSDWHKIDFRSRLYDQIDASVPSGGSRCIPAKVVPIIPSLSWAPDMVPVAAEWTSPFGQIRPVGLLTENSPEIESFIKGALVPDVARWFPPVPFDQRSAQVDFLQTLVSADSSVVVNVRVKNTSRVTWRMVRAYYPIRVGARVDSGRVTQREVRVEIGDALAPGVSRSYSIPLGQFADAGRHSVTIGVVQDGIAWFSGAITLDIDVPERGRKAPSRSASAPE